MDKNQLNKYIATIIIAIGPKGRPNSHVWMDVDPNMSDLEMYNLVLGKMVAFDLVKNTGHFLTLTDKGLAMHEKIVSLLAPTVREQSLKS